jgi:thioredoxin-dependent peroxiredoxin
MLRVGDNAPDFEAETTRGDKVRLSSFAGRRVVLYFFPKAFTAGCTIETKRFQGDHEELAALGAEVIGISTDDLATQCDFAKAHGVSFPMVGDKDHRIATAYGVLWPLLPLARRVTFVVGPDGAIEAVFKHELAIGRHIADVKKHLADMRE